MNKLIWYAATLETFTHQEALKYASSKGLRLPTIEEIKEAIKNKEDLGKEDFWSSSVHPNYPDFAFFFNGYYGYIGNDYRDSDYSVRCSISEKEIHDREFNKKLCNIIL